MGNLDIYNKLRTVPKEAQKPITGGRLSGYTDINPMWRIKALTEQFGPVGKGWYYKIKSKWTEDAATGEQATFVEIELFVKYDDEWSMPIPGMGGSMLAAKEKSGMRANDEAYKMALTDAISVACKELGVGAEIYWKEDKTKYDKPQEQEQAKAKPKEQLNDLSSKIDYIKKQFEQLGIYQQAFLDELLAEYGYNTIDEITEENVKAVAELAKSLAKCAKEKQINE